MLARIVEDWLISVGERGYEAAFAQVLTSEGYRVLHAPVHHPFEHGKDIVAEWSDGQLHAFQLKSGDIDLRQMDDLQGQLFALASTAVRYPGVEPPRAPDRAFLVTSGRLTPPARDRLTALNDASRMRGMTPIALVELDQLVGRMVRAHGEFLPRRLDDLSALLRLILSDGDGPFPVRTFAAILAQMLDPVSLKSALAARRRLTTATIIASYVAGPWQRKGNHLGVAEAWLVLALTSMWVAERRGLADADWLPTYELARDSARRSLSELVDEAVTAQDLVVPDIVDGVVYPARAAIVCGYASAFLASEEHIADASALRSQVECLLQREGSYVQAHGEGSAGLLLLIATAYEMLGDPAEAAKLMYAWALEVANQNAPDSTTGIPDPYHSIGELLLEDEDQASTLADEQFAGDAYTLHIALEWLARRGLRSGVEPLWPAVTRVHFCEFRPAIPAGLLAYDDPDGELHTWAPNAPQSWAELVRVSGVVKEAALPERLWQHLEILPYLPLVYPYRLTSAVAKALDYAALSRCSVELIEVPDG